jgi:sec-independent protein translocase protein TatA
MAWTFGAWEVILILAAFLLLFGSSKLPKLARSLGSSMTEFKKGLRGETPEEEEKEKLEGGPDDEQEEAQEPSEKNAD